MWKSASRYTSEKKITSFRISHYTTLQSKKTRWISTPGGASFKMDRGCCRKIWKEYQDPVLWARPANSYYLRDLINPVVVVRVFLRSLFINSINAQVVCAQSLTESDRVYDRVWIWNYRYSTNPHTRTWWFKNRLAEILVAKNIRTKCLARQHKILIIQLWTNTVKYCKNSVSLSEEIKNLIKNLLDLNCLKM